MVADDRRYAERTRISGWSMLACFILGGFPAMFLRHRGRSTWGAVWRSHALFWGVLLVGVAFDTWGGSLGWGNPIADVRELRGAILAHVALAAAIVLPLWVWLWPRLWIRGRTPS